MKVLKESLTNFYHKKILIDYFDFEISLFAHDNNTYFLVFIEFDAENQCENEGCSFYEFNSFDEMINFIVKNEDSKGMLDLFSKESILEFKKEIETCLSLKFT